MGCNPTGHYRMGKSPHTQFKPDDLELGFVKIRVAAAKDVGVGESC